MSIQYFVVDRFLNDWWNVRRERKRIRGNGRGCDGTGWPSLVPVVIFNRCQRIL